MEGEQSKTMPISRRLCAEKKRSSRGYSWRFMKDTENITYLYIPVQLSPSQHQRAVKIGRDPALLFSFDSNYPFRPPKVRYYNTNILELYRVGSLFFDDLKKLNNIGCLCCSSILCKDNWTPTNNIDDITDEFLKVMSWKAQVVERFMCKKIQEKILPNIESRYFKQIYEYL